MKMRMLIYCIYIVIGGGILPALAQKFSPKYIREDNRSFKALTKTATPDGWIEFKAEAKVAADNFFTVHGNAIGLSEGYQMKLPR